MRLHSQYTWSAHNGNKCSGPYLTFPLLTICMLSNNMLICIIISWSYRVACLAAMCFFRTFIFIAYLSHLLHLHFMVKPGPGKHSYATLCMYNLWLALVIWLWHVVVVVALIKHVQLCSCLYFRIICVCSFAPALCYESVCLW